MSGRVAQLLRGLRNYRFNSLFLQSFRLIFLGVALPLIIVILAVFFYSQQTLKREMEIANQRALHIVQNIGSTVVSEAQNAAMQLSFNTDVLESLRRELPRNYADYEHVRRIISTLELGRKSALCDSIYLYNLQNEYVITNSGYASRLNFVTDRDVLRRLPDIPKSGFLWVYRMLENPSTATPEWVLTLYRRVSTPGIDAVLAVNIREATLLTLLGSMEQGGKGRVLLVSDAGLVLFDSSLALAGAPVSALLADGAHSLGEGQTGSITMDIEGEHSMVSYAPLDSAGWSCLQIVPYRSYAQGLYALQGFVLLSIVLGLVVSLLLAVILGARLSRPIEQIVSFIDTASADPRSTGDNELNYILMHLVSLYDENEQLEQDRLSRYGALRQAQAHALQAQITPHFLHNTLQTVQWQVLRETGNEKSPALHALVMLADMARQTMEDTGNLTTLAQELSYVESYMALQKLRYLDALQYDTAIAPELLSCQVPRISLQPLVENALEHALQNRQGQGRVLVFAKAEGEGLVLGVQDDGEGMPFDAMTAYNQSFTVDGEPFIQHIGLGNLNQRIRLLFGEDYRLVITPSEWGGTTVRMHLPRRKAEG